MTSLVWIQRELRLQSTPVIHQALAESDKVILAYFHDPKQTVGQANTARLAASLLNFKSNIEQYSANLWMLEGDFETQLIELIKQQNIKQVYYSYQVGSPFVQMQQTALEVCQKYKVALTPFYSEFLLEPECLLNKQQKPYLVYTPFYKNFLTKQTQIEPIYEPLPSGDKLSDKANVLAKAGVIEVPQKYADLPNDLANVVKQPWATKILAFWPVGEEAAWNRLYDFIQEDIAGYILDRDFPAQSATSALSSYLHFGEISMRDVFFTLQAMVESGEVKADIAQPWLRQLVWKEFARHLLHWFPETEKQPFQKKYLAMQWPQDSHFIHLWQQGKTGIPIIDAGMQELWQTGIMHNRVRMLVASFLTKNLNQHWLVGKQWFDDTLLDADPANNVLGWQWVAGIGVDAAPYYRLFNPVTQSVKFDKTGEYIKSWLPQLKNLSNKAVHEPWLHKQECELKGLILGKDYPYPLVDLKQSRAEHLDRVSDMKSG